MSPETVVTWCSANSCTSASALFSFLLLLGIVFHFGTSEQVGGPRRAAALTFQIVGWIGLATIVAYKLIVDGRWGELLALIPPALIVRHAVYLRLVRRRGMAAGSDGQREARKFDKKSFVDIFASARASQDREFSVDVLAVRYGIPAGLLAAVSIAYVRLLSQPADALQLSMHFPDGVWMGAKAALAGAYTYVVLYLGQRSLRRDLTSGAAVWSAVTMTLGPVLGGVFALMWKKDVNDTDWSAYALYFVAGLSPRYATAAVEEAVRRLWLTRSGAATVIPKTIPLTEIRGITLEIEDRLGEEGITDACSLAMAAPMKLYRNTAFDQRQILCWIDEALLAIFFPDDWKDVRSGDVSGAIDLAARFSRVRKLAPAEGDTFDLLAKRIGKPTLTRELLRDIASLVYEDAQVELVWTLYQVSDGAGDDMPFGGTVRAAPPRLRSPDVFARPLPAVVAPGLLAAATGMLLAMVFWTTDWPFSVGQEIVTLAFGAMGAGLALGVRAGRPSNSQGLYRTLGVIVGGVLIVAGAALLLSSPSVTGMTWKTGLVLLSVSCAILGASIAWTVSAVLFRRSIEIAVVSRPPAPSPRVELNGAQVIADAAGKHVATVGRGVHEVRVRCQGYRDTLQWFETARLWNGRVEVRLEPAVPSRVDVHVRPKCAEGVVVTCCSVTDRTTSREPDADGLLWLEEGTWLISATADGFGKRTIVEELRGGESREVRLKLKREAAPVTVAVPAGATLVGLLVDGVAQPIEQERDSVRCALRTGERELRVRWRAPLAADATQASRLQVETQRVVIPRGGCTFPFPMAPTV